MLVSPDMQLAVASLDDIADEEGRHAERDRARFAWASGRGDVELVCEPGSAEPIDHDGARQEHGWAGLYDVEEWDVPTAIVTESPEQYWQLLTELTAPVVDTLQRVDAATRQRIAETVIADATSYTSAGVVRIPGKARCAIGTK